MRRTLSTILGLCLLAGWWVPAGLAQSVQPGTEVKVRLIDRLDTGETQAGQQFSGTIAEPVRSGRRTILAKGARVRGKVTEVVSSGRLKRPASISLQLTDTGRNAVQTQALQIDGNSHAVRNVALIGGGAGAGAILGAVAGGGKGAAIGAAAGAGAGTATAYLTGKQEIVLPSETVLTFVVAGTATSTNAGESAASRAAPRYSEGRDPSWRDDRDEDGNDPLIFSRRQQHLIRSYFYSEHNGRGLPPGLAKRNGKLPPGLAKQVRRNGTLPPGLQRQADPFPWELTRQLPRLPRGYSRVLVEGRALIVGRDNRILDVMVIFRD